MQELSIMPNHSTRNHCKNKFIFVAFFICTLRKIEGIVVGIFFNNYT